MSGRLSERVGVGAEEDGELRFLYCEASAMERGRRGLAILYSSFIVTIVLLNFMARSF